MLETFSAAGFCVPAGGSVPRGYSGQPLRALFTAWTIREMVTIAPDGMPLGQEDASAFPRSIYTRVMTLFTATVPLPSQSPTHVAQPLVQVVGVDSEVGVAVAESAVGVDCEVGVAAA